MVIVGLGNAVECLDWWTLSIDWTVYHDRSDFYKWLVMDKQLVS